MWWLSFFSASPCLWIDQETRGCFKIQKKREVDRLIFALYIYPLTIELQVSEKFKPYLRCSCTKQWIRMIRINHSCKGPISRLKYVEMLKSHSYARNFIPSPSPPSTSTTFTYPIISPCLSPHRWFSHWNLHVKNGFSHSFSRPICPACEQNCLALAPFALHGLP